MSVVFCHCSSMYGKVVVRTLCVCPFCFLCQEIYACIPSWCIRGSARVVVVVPAVVCHCSNVVHVVVRRLGTRLLFLFFRHVSAFIGFFEVCFHFEAFIPPVLFARVYVMRAEVHLSTLPCFWIVTQHKHAREEQNVKQTAVPRETRAVSYTHLTLPTILLV